MNLPARLPKNSGLIVLSLSLAFVLWLFVNYDRESETEMTVPVRVVNVPQGLDVTNQLPHHLVVRVAGPRIQLMRLVPERLTVSLDLGNLREGTVAFPDLGNAVPVPRELRVTRIYPSMIEIELRKAGRLRRN
ncbi:YbbR-like domain-containing protein [Geobacter sp. DSM 9736]|uniref:CdaR family protein n=1 Tax=Geobacter sp. DSM 9736 TaxID=1277350 RepID=UPI000B50FBCD|nr:hypothetical protein [Geobacter sp. DSM 9736]SNB45146.1 hypothetical protein SAMN06269301_0543 [Geobacter sp. DSM 9736]